MLWRSSRGCPEKVLAASRINLSGTSLERQIRTSPELHFRTSPGRQIGTSLEWWNRIFRGRPPDVGGDVLRTSWGLIFAGWVKTTEKGVNLSISNLSNLISKSVKALVTLFNLSISNSSISDVKLPKSDFFATCDVSTLVAFF